MAEKGRGRNIRALFEATRQDILPYREKSYFKEGEECSLENEDTVPLIRFRAFEPFFPEINAAFSTRFGGVSKKEELLELNFGFDRGDETEYVQENYKRFCESMGEDYRSLVLSDQVHETKVYRAGEKDRTGEIVEKKLRGVDGLISGEEVVLATSYADCVPLLFAEPVKRVIAAAHSGWRGTVGKIGEKTVQAFAGEYGSRKEDIIAVIGPSICQNCYEVSGDVVLEFKKAFSREQIAEIVKPSTEKEGKYQLDLWAANFFCLKEAGLLPEHIHVSGICTCHHPGLLFSHRASHGRRGNLNAFIALHRAFPASFF
ncbi:MAG: peptidoglycan editing factor PgeF [Lachnospiraceae bacterium]|nr:peptidoglycan editing factor PgeF [Lachnospiraceae bacterium]